jgi:uncharacterized protein (TIGR00290 family)
MLALHELQRQGRRRVAALLTTVAGEELRVSGHGVRAEVVDEQARSLGFPLHTLETPDRPTNEAYEAALGGALARYRGAGMREIAYGDLALEDVRAYRERVAASIGMTARFPLWGRDTALLAHEFLRLGYRAVVCCVDRTRLSDDFAGRPYDAEFIRDLPPGIDPAGEGGEFHTFVFDGPLFRVPVELRPGPVFLHDERFAVCELRPAAPSAGRDGA